MDSESIKSLADRLRQTSETERAKLSAAARASAAPAAARFLRFAIGARVRDLASGQLGEVIAADRDATSRWERYRVRLVDAREVFRSDRELELAPTIFVSLLLVLLLASGAAAQTTAGFAWDLDSPQTEVATWVQTFILNGQAVTAPITCAPKPGAPTQTACSIPLPAPLTGKSTVEINATKSSTTASTRIVNFDPANVPKTATTPRYTITVVVNLP
jgi:hypothetical protein